MSLNLVIIVGRLGKDIELKTAGSSEVANFTLATNEDYRDKKTQEKVKQTEWHKIECWGKLAEIAERFASKGSIVQVTGSLKTRSYESDGRKVYVTYVKASSVQVYDSNKGQDTQQEPAPKTNSNSGTQYTVDDIDF